MTRALQGGQSVEGKSKKALDAFLFISILAYGN
jgi:hypothetical protein